MTPFGCCVPAELETCHRVRQLHLDFDDPSGAGGTNLRRRRLSSTRNVKKHTTLHLRLVSGSERLKPLRIATGSSIVIHLAKRSLQSGTTQRERLGSGNGH